MGAVSTKMCTSACTESKHADWPQLALLKLGRMNQIQRPLQHESMPQHLQPRRQTRAFPCSPQNKASNGEALVQQRQDYCRQCALKEQRFQPRLR
eukprot:scaffold141724_cov18-Tisochrysis_lutea.AAC.1